MKRYLKAGDCFGALTFVCDIEEKTPEKRLMSTWTCQCGKTQNYATGRVVSGVRNSCGCVGKAAAKAAVTKHGMKGSKVYGAWGGIKDRCLNPGSKDYARYGAKGISLFPDWAKSFESFYSYIGPPPTPRHQVDRIDGRIGYEPGNVRWATPKQQCMNRLKSKRWFIKGLVFESITDAASHFGVAAQTIHKWCNGYTDKRRGTFSPPREDCHADFKY